MPIIVVLVGIGILGYLAGRNASQEGRDVGREDRYDHLLRAAAARHMPTGWDWRILKAMVRQESSFRPNARSRVGALGLCQMMPKTAKAMGVSPKCLCDPRVSIDVGTKYLRRLWDRWEGLPDRPPRWTRSRFAIASYNAGITRLRCTASKTGAKTWPQLRPHVPRETQIHIRKVFDEFYPLYASQPLIAGHPERPSFSGNRP